MGKGRTIAGLVLENWRCGRQRHLWLTIGTDLRIDSRRDLDDVGATDIPLHPLNKLPYGQLDSDKVGMGFCTCQREIFRPARLWQGGSGFLYPGSARSVRGPMASLTLTRWDWVSVFGWCTVNGIFFWPAGL